MSESHDVRIAFDVNGIRLPLDRILPLKNVESDPKKSPTFARIVKSIAEVGVIEPLIVYPHKSQKGMYLLLDGHLRLNALKRLGKPDVFCLISTEDEAYTYNHKVSRVTPIQEHFMIMKAIEQGVSEERIAATLDIDVARIRQKARPVDRDLPGSDRVIEGQRCFARSTSRNAKGQTDASN